MSRDITSQSHLDHGLNPPLSFHVEVGNSHKSNPPLSFHTTSNYRYILCYYTTILFYYRLTILLYRSNPISESDVFVYILTFPFDRPYCGGGAICTSFWGRGCLRSYGSEASLPYTYPTFSNPPLSFLCPWSRWKSMVEVKPPLSFYVHGRGRKPPLSFHKPTLVFSRGN